MQKKLEELKNKNNRPFLLVPQQFTYDVNNPKHSAKVKDTAKLYTSDLDLKKLLRDGSKLLGYHTTATRVILNETGEEITDLSQVKAQSYLVLVVDKPKRSFESKTLRLFTNVYPVAGSGKIYHTKQEGLPALLREATGLLHLSSQAQIAYTEEGDIIDDLSYLDNGSVVYISCGEPCAYVDFKAKHSVSPSKAGSTNIKTNNLEHVSNHLIAMSSFPVEENMLAARLAVFASMPLQEKLALKTYDSLKEQMYEYMVHGLCGHLATEMICPVVANSVVEKPMKLFAAENLKGVTLNDIKYAITGPRLSGKTSILYYMAAIFMRKLILCGETANFLMFPINFQLHDIVIDQPRELYELFIETAFTASRYCQLSFLPCAQSLRQWFLNIATIKPFRKIPQIEGVDLKSLTDIGQQFYNCFNSNRPERSYTQLCDLLVQFPNIFAKAIGLERAILILDHYEEAGDVLGVALTNNLSNYLYFVSSQFDKDFYEIFKVIECKFVYTDKAITVQENRILSIPESILQISIDDCLGCPGFISAFLKICSLLEKSSRTTARPAKFASIRTKTDLSRKFQIRQETAKLCISLKAAENKKFNESILNLICDFDERITIQFLDTSKPKPAPAKAKGASPKAQPKKPSPKKEVQKPIAQKEDTSDWSEDEDNPKPSKKSSPKLAKKNDSDDDWDDDEPKQIIKNDSDDELRRKPKSRASKIENDDDSSWDDDDSTIKPPPSYASKKSAASKVSQKRPSYLQDSGSDDQHAPSVTSKKSSKSKSSKVAPKLDDDWDSDDQHAPSHASKKSSPSKASKKEKVPYDSDSDDYVRKPPSVSSKKSSPSRASKKEKNTFDSDSDNQPPPSVSSKKSSPSRTSKQSPKSKNMFDSDSDSDTKPPPSVASKKSSLSKSSKVKPKNDFDSDDYYSSKVSKKSSPSKKQANDDDYYSDDERAPALSRSSKKSSPSRKSKPTNDYYSDDDERKPPQSYSSKKSSPSKSPKAKAVNNDSDGYYSDPPPKKAQDNKKKANIDSYSEDDRPSPPSRKSKKSSKAAGSDWSD